jgi:hypothetical protein
MMAVSLIGNAQLKGQLIIRMVLQELEGFQEAQKSANNAGV